MIKASAAWLALGTIIAVAGPGPASARDYPYCLQGHEWGYPGNCQFSSYEQCMATASGTLAGCGINPRMGYDTPPEPRRRHRRH